MRKSNNVPDAARGTVVYNMLNGQTHSAARASQKPKIKAAAASAKASQLITQPGVAATRPASSWRSSQTGDHRGQPKAKAGAIASSFDRRPARMQAARTRYAGDPAPANGTPAKGAGAPAGSAASPPPNGPNLGANLMAAYRLLDVAGMWLEQLAAEYEAMLGMIGKASEFSFATTPLDVMDDPFTDGEGWVYNGWHWSYLCRQRRQRIGCLSFIVDLGRPGRPAHALGYPCALIAWSGVGYDWLPALSVAGGFWPPSATTTQLVANRLFQWTGTMPGNGPNSGGLLRSASWFYVVPLTAISSVARLRSLVVQPALDLLKGAEVEAVFAKLPDVLRFERREDKLAIAG